MIQIHSSTHCGNSSKNKRVKDFIIALESFHIDSVISQGIAGTVTGTQQMGFQSKGFCHLLEFTSATCKTIGRTMSDERL